MPIALINNDQGKALGTDPKNANEDDDLKEREGEHGGLVQAIIARWW
jgi:hypothetical protein